MEIPYTMLDSETLDRVIEEFVLREGTDYGHRDIDLEAKVAAVRRQLQRGEVKLTWDAELETCNLVSAAQLREQERAAAGSTVDESESQDRTYPDRE